MDYSSFDDRNGLYMTPFESKKEYYDTSFKNISIETAEIRNKEFYECVFTHCSLLEAQINKCRLVDCVFCDCDLSMVDVTGSSFRSTKFKRSKLVGVNWTVASWPSFISVSPIEFRECKIDYSTFIGLSLPKIIVKRCTAQEVEFSEADLSGADFRYTNLENSRFRQTNLERANFEGALNYNINLTLNKVTKARFAMPEALSLLYGLDIILVD